MYEKVGWKIVLIILIVGCALYFMFPPFSGMVPGWLERALFGAWPQSKGKLVLGEDLKGGLTIVLSVNNPDKRDSVIEVLNRRMNASGLKEVYITALGEGQIQVRAPAESPGLKDMLLSTGTLEFRAEATDEEYRDYDKIREKAAASDRPIPRPQAGLIVQENERGRGGRRYLLLHSKVEFAAQDFADFYPTIQKNNPVVGFRLSSPAAPRFAELTRKLSKEYGTENGRLAVFVNGKFESAPSVKDVITHSGIVTFGDTGDIEDAYKKQNELLIALRSGALQTPITFESEIKTGPAIGEDSLRRGILSLLLGALFVLLFMLVYYLAAGLIANVALILNLIIVLGALCGFQATFTLPGFAGLILTIGMAVDANILIFERIREEKAAGKALRGAVKAGYDRAFGTILDSNITTLIIGIILWWQGTGPIRGFAITLSVGILASLFTALFVGKVIFTILVNVKAFKEVKMQYWIRRPNIPFMKLSKVPLTISLILIAGGVGLLIARGSSLLGIDFLGGAQYQINLDRAITIEDARSRLADILPEGTAPEVQSVQPPLGEEQPGQGSYGFVIRFPQLLLDRIAENEKISSESDPSVVISHVERLLRDRFEKDFPPKGLEVSIEESRFGRIDFDLVPAEGIPRTRLEDSVARVLKENGYTDDRFSFRKPAGGKMLKVSLNTEYQGRELQSILDRIKEGLDKDDALGAEAYKFVNVTDLNADPTPVVVIYVIVEVPPHFSDAQAKEFLNRIPGVVTHTIRSNTTRETEGSATGGYKVIKVEQVPGENLKKYSNEGGKKYQKFRTETECRDNFQTAVQMLTTILSKNLPEEEIVLSDDTKTRPVIAPGGIGQALAITGSVAKELRYKGFTAFILAIAGIILYVWFRFRQFRFSVAAVVALMHDVLITIGILALLDSLPFFTIKFELPVVAALLTIVGYSINDSIVVFDRIRENMGLHRDERYFIQNLDNSINQTLTRTVWTSLTTFTVVLCLALLGGDMIRGFAITMCIGVLVGTYSSIFIASPVVVWFHRRDMGAMSAAAKFTHGRK